MLAFPLNSQAEAFLKGLMGTWLPLLGNISGSKNPATMAREQTDRETTDSLSVDGVFKNPSQSWV